MKEDGSLFGRMTLLLHFDLKTIAGATGFSILLTDWVTFVHKGLLKHMKMLSVFKLASFFISLC